MRKKQVVLGIIGVCVVLIVGFLCLRQPTQVSDDIENHDTTYYQELINKNEIKSDGITDALQNLPRNAIVKQASSIVNDEDAFHILGLSFEPEANVDTILYDICLLSAFYEDVDTISISFEDKEMEFEKKSIEQFIEKELTHQTLLSKIQWNEIKTSIQQMDKGTKQAFLF